MTLNPSVNRTACKLRLQVRPGLRPPPAGYVDRYPSVEATRNGMGRPTARGSLSVPRPLPLRAPHFERYRESP